MSAFKLGGVDPLPVRSYSGLDYADVARRIALIGDGTSTDRNEVIQSGPLQGREATLSGLILDDADIDTLRAYRSGVEVVTFSAPDSGGDISVILLNFRAPQSRPGFYQYEATVVEVAGGGS